MRWARGWEEALHGGHADGGEGGVANCGDDLPWLVTLRPAPAGELAQKIREHIFDEVGEADWSMHEADGAHEYRFRDEADAAAFASAFGGQRGEQLDPRQFELDLVAA